MSTIIQHHTFCTASSTTILVLCQLNLFSLFFLCVLCLLCSSHDDTFYSVHLTELLRAKEIVYSQQPTIQLAA